MAKLGRAEAFAKYGTKLKNAMWSVCAEAPDGSLVVSLWQHHFGKATGGAIVCKGACSRWSGHGNREFRVAIAKAHETKQVVRAIISTSSDPDAIERGEDGSKFSNTFAVRTDLVGEVIEFDGENYAIRFTKA